MDVDRSKTAWRGDQPRYLRVRGAIDARVSSRREKGNRGVA